jgi:hypothetical protein
VAPEFREEAIGVMMSQIIEKIDREDLILFMGYIPDNSPNLRHLEREIAPKLQNDYDGGIATNHSRGGVYPWTTLELQTELGRLSEVTGAHDPICERITNLQNQLKSQNSALLAYAKTRTTLEHELKDIIQSLAGRQDATEILNQLTSLLNPKPIAYPFLALPKNKEQFLESLGSSNRYYFKRYTKKLIDQNGEVEHVPPDRVQPQDLDDYLSLHLDRWGSESVAVNQQTRPFHLELGKILADLGFVHLFFIRLDGQRVASHACIDIAGRREYYFSGRKLQLNKIPAGKLLCFHTLLDAIDRGLEVYDFGYGGDDYKFVFTDTQRTLKSIVLAKKGHLPDINHLFPKFEYFAFSSRSL